MRNIAIIWISVMGLLFGACAQDSPTDPVPVPVSEKSAGRHPDIVDGYYENANQDAKTKRTFKNARVLYRAALRFTADNGGMCVRSPFHQNLLGRRMTEYLPGGTLLRNEFIGRKVEPQDRDASSPGQIGYEGIISLDGIVGFRITAMGATDDDYLEIEYITPGIPMK